MDGESWVVSGPQVIEVDEVGSVRVGLIGGRVDVIGRDEPGGRIEVHRVEGRPLEVRLVEGELQVGYAATLAGWDQLLDRFRATTSRDEADVHVAVPRDVAVHLGTVCADGLLAGVAGASSVATVSGSVVTDSTRGPLAARTVSGELDVREHDGDLELTSVSGPATASGSLGRVGARTVSGAVTIDARRALEVTAHTVSGDVTIRLPAALGVSVDGRNVSGRVVVDGRDHGAKGPGGGAFRAVVGDGACHVRATTVSGDVTLLRSGGDA